MRDRSDYFVAQSHSQIKVNMNIFEFGSLQEGTSNLGLGKVVAEIWPGWVEVKWSSGNITFYRYGHQDQFEIRPVSADYKLPEIPNGPLPNLVVGDRVVRHVDWRYGDVVS